MGWSCVPDDPFPLPKSLGPTACPRPTARGEHAFFSFLVFSFWHPTATGLRLSWTCFWENAIRRSDPARLFGLPLCVGMEALRRSITEIVDGCPGLKVLSWVHEYFYSYIYCLHLTYLTPYSDLRTVRMDARVYFVRFVHPAVAFGGPDRIP